MAETERIAISLSKALLREIEELRRETRETRSGIIRRAVERMLEEREKAQGLAAYVEGYRRQPETQDEVDAAEAAATELLAREPWL